MAANSLDCRRVVVAAVIFLMGNISALTLILFDVAEHVRKPLG
jgi:hypothetical protein